MNDSNYFIEYNGHQINVKTFRKNLITWGKVNFRPFPWRFTRDPYKILVAEIMLKRTQAKQVVPVYNNFIARYPEISSLRGLSKEKLHLTLGSLGLRWRVDLFFEMINILFKEYCGKIPCGYDELMSLPGVSYYTAGAVRCFAWNYPEALIDTNTMRIVCRVFGKKIVDSIRRNKEFMGLMKLLVDPEFPGAYNFALLDLADSICIKRDVPVCKSCPVLIECNAGQYPMN